MELNLDPGFLGVKELSSLKGSWCLGKVPVVETGLMRTPAPSCENDSSCCNNTNKNLVFCMYNSVEIFYFNISQLIFLFCSPWSVVIKKKKLTHLFNALKSQKQIHQAPWINKVL